MIASASGADIGGSRSSSGSSRLPVRLPAVRISLERPGLSEVDRPAAWPDIRDRIRSLFSSPSTTLERWAVRHSTASISGPSRRPLLSPRAQIRDGDNRGQ